MANNNQNEFPLPVSIDQQSKRQTARHLPRFFRTDSNQTFLAGTLDPLIQPGKLDHVNGYVGRRDLPNYSFDDNYINAASMERQYYQLEPAVIYEDPVKGEVEWFADYIDYINALKFYGAPHENHDRLNKQETYSWNPHIDWDKFINFREYYWLPNGPDPINIYGVLEKVTSTYTVTSQQELDNVAYIFSPDGFTANPKLTLYRGLTYRFEIDAPNKLFCIKTNPQTGPAYFYNLGVSQQLVEKGVLEFTVPFDAPDLLYYLDNNSINTIGMIDVKDPADAGFLDVEAEILGKKNFKSGNGVDFINGLKIKFEGQIQPAKYATGFWYVEGVGNKIKLISFSDLETPLVYGPTVDVPFDYQPFDSLPFEEAANYPLEKDYITVNRASRDRNTWSRNNRWFHRNVIEAAAKANNQISNPEQIQRAKRPIIEFEADLKLLDHGWVAKKDVDLIDTVTTDVFSTIEGSLGYYVDGEPLLPGYRVLFTADPDILVNGRIFEVKSVYHFEEENKKTQLTLQEVFDTEPNEGEVVYATKGASLKGHPYYYQDGTWKQAQTKISVNQCPLFDLFDEQKISYSSQTYYPFNTFSGNKLFSYKVGTTGNVDKELGFPLSYLNINNVGDIQFESDLQNKSWIYQNNSVVTEVKSYAGFLRKYEDNNSFSYSNGWTLTDRKPDQPVVRILKIESATDTIPIDVYDNSSTLKDLRIVVYVNDVKRTDITRVNSTVDENGNTSDLNLAYIKFSTTLNVGDKVVYKAVSLKSKNLRGYYQIPLNWQNNPYNDPIASFTFGEVTDHVHTVVENSTTFEGSFPGVSNLANIGPVAPYGRRFLQHSGLMPLAAYLLVDNDANIIKSLRWTAREYTLFKKEFLRIATSNSFEGSIAGIVDQILLRYSYTKYIDTAPFYFSDMAPYGATSTREYVVNDPRLPYFIIDSIYDTTKVSKRTILVYVNDVQIIKDVDYDFDTTDAFVRIKLPLQIGDRITIRDYSTTDGCYIPHTPTKLGLYPSYVPMKYLDDTFVEPVMVIQGHDGSIIKAYGDFRDDIILELEKRIYNNIRVHYDPDIFDINTVFPSYYRKTAFSKDEIDSVMIGDFLRWNSKIDQDFNSNLYYVEENSFTFNYNKSTAVNGETLPGYWRGVYKYFYDTDRPHTHPWEMQGFTLKPVWWDSVYGPAPYTSENKILWDAIEQGLINDPQDSRINPIYARPGLKNYLPVDTDGNLLSPFESNLPQDFALVNAKGSYSFGDNAPVESSWRRSSDYAFSIVSALCVLRGSEFIGKMWDRFRIKRNIAGQMYWEPTGGRVQVSNFVFPTKFKDGYLTGADFTCGLVNLIEDYIFISKFTNISEYHRKITNIKNKLSHRIGGFTSKEKLKVLLDSRSPTASGTVFLPFENYKIFYNVSFPVSTVAYSGVIIEKLGSSYAQWESNKKYKVGDKVVFRGDIYECRVTHISNSDPALSVTDRFLKADASNWIYISVQQTGFKIRGYDNEKNYFSVFLPIVTSTDPSFNIGGVSEEFTEWTPGNYYPKGVIVKFDAGYYRSRVAHTASDVFSKDTNKWVVLPSLPITGGVVAIRRSRFRDNPIKVPYGTVFQDIQSVVDFLLGYQKSLEAQGFLFDEQNRDLNVPMNWLTSVKEFMFWTLQNWAPGAIITLSPSADLLKFKSKITASIDNFFEDFYDYSIFKADGAPLKPELSRLYREDNGFYMKPSTQTNDGIYHVRTNLVYREHVLVLDNTSIFNDVVYDVVPGYRQGRIKLVGFKTSNWDGGFTTPGFLYDEAKVDDWKTNTDYNIGDMVTYKGYYFTATSKIFGKSKFDYADWSQINKVPTQGLLPNLDYKVEQFRDFYSLEASNYDVNQQSLARHYIGYQPRQYLDNIIIDDVAQYKFYQGFIREKGTANSITKLFDALRASGFSSIDFKEEWAFKLGEYGSSDSILELEFPLDETKFRYNPQDIVLSQQPVEDLTVYNLTPKMITVKPSNYDSEPFNKIKIDQTQTNYGVFKYMVAGYVKDEDVNHIVLNEAALMNYDINNLSEGDKIWLGFTSNNDWDVLEFTKSNITITNWSVQENTVTLQCNYVPDVVKDQIIVLSNLDVLDGFYKVQRVYSNFIEIFTFNTTVYRVDSTTTSGIMFKLVSSRYDSPAHVSTKRYNTTNVRGQTIWIDSDESGRWLVLKNEDAFTKNELEAEGTVSDQHFGYDVTITHDDKRLIVTSPDNQSGKVFVYDRPNNQSSWALIQMLSLFDDVFTVSNTERFGSSVDITYSGKFLVVGIPNASDFQSIYENGTYYGNNGGTSSGLSNQGAAAIYKYNSVNRRYDLEVVLGSSDPRANEKFGSKVKISDDGVNVWLFVAAKNYNNDTGRVQVFKRENEIWKINSQQYLTFTNPAPGALFGYDLDCTEGAGRIVVSAPLLGPGAVYVFDRQGDVFTTSLIINSTTLQNAQINPLSGDSYLSANDMFGYSVAISDNRLFVSCPNDDNGGSNTGSVYYFIANQANVYSLNQIIYPPSTYDNERFGSKIKINTKTDILAVSAIGGDSVLAVTFDSYADRLVKDQLRNYALDSSSTPIHPTTFDKNSTSFHDRVPYTGSVFVYNRFDNEFIYGDKILPQNGLSTDDNFGAAVDVSNNGIVVGTPNAYKKSIRTGTVYLFDYNNLSWNVASAEDSIVDITKFKRAFIYNTQRNELIENLDFVDPAKGRIPKIAEQDIKYQTFYDPAIYEYGFNNEVSVDTSAPWTDEHIGEVWWDLSTVKYVWYEQGDTSYRSANWGRIFSGCTVDVYEWVESTYLPSKWATLADTDAGLAQGISGVPKNIDDFTYSSKFKYDPVSGTKTTLYYYWVKNKVTIPLKKNRSISCADITRLILDPKSQGYQFVAITDSNSLFLTNIHNKLIHDSVSINIQTYLIDNSDLMTHRQYALIAENDPSAIIPPMLEQKWFDSLIGATVNGNLVPDNKLSKKQRYGNLNSPRQGWFVNRFEALKQLFEYVNSVLINQQIIDNVNFRALNSMEMPPSTLSGEIDTTIDILEDLQYVGTVKTKTAKLSVRVVNGQIEDVFIDDAGYGYGRNRAYTEDQYGTATSWYGPTIKIYGKGSEAALQSVIDNQGRITKVEIVKAGRDYDSSTRLTVRDYTVLVKVDVDTDGGWSLHTWNSVKKNWTRSRTQAYNVTRYWSYADWYIDPGYKDTTDLAYSIDRTVDLNKINVKVGEIVKINNVGKENTWLLLERVSVTNDPDFTVDYTVVGKQNATIQFSDKIYNLNNDIGYDIKFSYDRNLYDQNPSREIRTILKALRDDILINDLRIEYIRTFFNSVYYVLSEQLYTDWMFKTSFLKIFHNVGTLKQRLTFQSDVVDSYQSYIEEAKPYRTKIREFVSSYNSIDTTNTLITDFDLPPYFNIDAGSIEPVNEYSNLVSVYPWKNWLDNHTYELTEIVIKDQGSNYITIPKVIISGGGGTGAKASAYVSKGKVYKIVIDDPGTGFISPPSIEISGGNGDVEEFKAKAYAIIGNSKARINTINMKLDRYTQDYTVPSYRFLDTFVGDGKKSSFKLSYAPEIEKNKFRILVDDIEIYGNGFSVSINEAEHETYTALEGYVAFSEIPVEGAVITIAYDKNIRLYSAADRIGYAYNPTEGQYGKYLNQLMTGIDYGGVTVTSIEFEVGAGWDILPWDVSSWDALITSNDDYVVRIDINNAATRIFELPYIPAVGEVINVYINDIRIDDPYYSLYDGITVQPNGLKSAPPNRIMDSFVGNGVDNIVILPTIIPPELNFIDSDLTFRKSTSDGTILPTDRSAIDSIISGGNLAYNTALGTLAEDISIDGDGFVTPDTSFGPEELVQGQVVDTLSIKVYHAPSSGGPNVIVKNFTGDGATTQYPIDSRPDTEDGVLVLVDREFYDFTIDYPGKNILLDVAPPLGSKIAIITIDTAGYDILAKESFVGDGTVTEFLTSARYSKDNITVFVTVNGIEVSALVKASDETYDAVNDVVVVLDQPPEAGDYVQIMVFSGNIQKYSKVTAQYFDMVPGQYVYDLGKAPAVSGPLSAKVLVIVDNEFLRAPYYKHFTFDGSVLEIDDNRFYHNSLRLADIAVYNNGVKLDPVKDYNLDSANSRIKISEAANVVNGDEVIVEIFRDHDFKIVGSQVVITNNFNIVNKQILQVSTFTNHDILKIKRSNTGFYFSVGYDELDYDVTRYDLTSATINTSGIFDLPRTVSNKSGVFVGLDRQLLEPNVDYIVLDNKRQIKVLLPDFLNTGSYIEIITTSEFTTTPSFGFKIFKDMLNRTQYKRLNKETTTVLAADFSVYDTNIIVGGNQLFESLDPIQSDQNPLINFPGIIEIAGERIEYFVQDGNVLKQLRRGTLGTSINSLVPAGTKVESSSLTETIPYTDEEIKITHYGDGNIKTFGVDFVPALANTTRSIDKISNGTAGIDRITVASTADLSVGMYVISDKVPVGTVISSIVNKTLRLSNNLINDIVNETVHFSTWYRDTIPYNEGQCDQIEVFVAGRRLRKVPITVFDPTLGQDSYQHVADKQIEAEFSVDGLTQNVRLTEAPAAGDLVVILYKKGRTWQLPSEDLPLVYSQTNIARFLTSKQVDLPK